MHDHNNNDNGIKSMMWMMVICCAVPLALILFFGVGGKALGAPTWVVFGGVAVMIAIHLFMMNKLHKRGDEEHDMSKENGEQNLDYKKDSKNHSSHGRCH